MTTEEILLWGELRNKKLGVKFRRQHPIARYIVDFYCHEHKLVIEVDGKIHLHPEVQLNDKNREYELLEIGLKILRFTNEEVTTDLNGVIDQIKEHLKK